MKSGRKLMTLVTFGPIFSGYKGHRQIPKVFTESLGLRGSYIKIFRHVQALECILQPKRYSKIAFKLSQI